jgi:hypothetical protein
MILEGSILGVLWILYMIFEVRITKKNTIYANTCRKNL